ncbi:hypothetical protein DY126_06870 [Apilactobacillus micheneri]|nr:hypothetical protein DY126_06870 [Apilactobacillus micheneri]
MIIIGVAIVSITTIITIGKICNAFSQMMKFYDDLKAHKNDFKKSKKCVKKIINQPQKLINYFKKSFRKFIIKHLG